jgi:hypothetical protein
MRPFLVYDRQAADGRRQTAPATTRLHTTALLVGPHMVGGRASASSSSTIVNAAQGHSTPPNAPV